MIHEMAIQQLVGDRIASLHDTSDRLRAARRARRTQTVVIRSSGAAGPVARADRPSRRVPAPFTHEFASWAGQLGMFVAERGVGAAERSVAGVVRQARRQGVGGSAVAVLADRRVPAVARERALGLVLTRLTSSRGATGVSSEGHVA